MIHRFRLEFNDCDYPSMHVYDRRTGEFVARVSYGLGWQHKHDDRVCFPVGYNVHESYQGRGVMTWVLKVFMFKCRHIKHFQACCYDDNFASQRVLEKCGFKLVSKGRIYHYEFRKDFQNETLSDEKRGPVDSHQRGFGRQEAA